MKKLSQYKEISFDIIIYGCSIIIPKLSLFFLIPILTRVLDPSVYGFIDLFSNLSGFLGVLLISGMDHSYAYQYGQTKNKDKQKLIRGQLLGNRMIQIFGLIPMLMIGVFFLQPSLLKYHIPFNIIIIVLIATAGMSLFLFGLETLRLKENKKDYVILAFIQVIVTITLILVLVVHLKLVIWGYFMAWLISYCMAIPVYYLMDKDNRVRPIFNWGSYKQTISTSIPFLPSQLMPWCILGIAELAILIIVSEHAMGIFAVSARLVLFLSNTLEIVRRSVWPRLLNISHRHQDRLVSIIKSFLVLSFFGLIAMSMLTPAIFKIVVGEAFYSSVQVFPLLCIMVVGLAFNYLISLNFIQRKRMSFFWWIYCATLIPIIGISTYFLEKVGLMGITYSIIIGIIFGNIIAIALSDFNQKYKLFIWYGGFSIAIISYLF